MLLDSGATGSCVNKSFVEKHSLMIKKLPIKILIYNANGTLNNNRSVEGFTEVRMTIGDHLERIELAVTNLGSSDIFLGLEWLRLHNPDIDWTLSLLSFNRCPDRCGYRPWWSSPEEGEVLNRLNEGDQIFLFDWEGYIHKDGHIRLMGSPTDKYVNDFPEVFKKQGFDSLLE